MFAGPRRNIAKIDPRLCRTGLSPATGLSAGFKLLFWAEALAPKLLATSSVRFTHLLLFDSDMVVRPRDFDLVSLLRLGEAVNASLIQPSLYGGGSGLYSLGSPRCPESDACKCSPRPDRQCIVCLQPVVEVKAPLITMSAWSVIHRHVLSRVSRAALTESGARGKEMLDLVWCGLLDHHLHGGCRPADPKKTRPECIAKVGVSCAVSFATPIRHLHHRSIKRSAAGLGIDLSNRSANSLYASKGATEARHFFMDRLKLYRKFPSWRPFGSRLTVAPCWGDADSAMRRALRKPASAYNASRPPRVRFPPRLEWWSGANSSRRAGEASEHAYQARLVSAWAPSQVAVPSREETLRNDDYPPSHGCQAVLNQWCESNCAAPDSNGSSTASVFLARRRNCHADECRRFHIYYKPTDWQCFPTDALAPDWRSVADWARNATSGFCGKLSVVFPWKVGRSGEQRILAERLGGCLEQSGWTAKHYKKPPKNAKRPSG